MSAPARRMSLQLSHYLHRIKIKKKPKIITTLIGLHQSIRRGFGIDFYGFRDYQLGDNHHYIDWRVSSRRNKLTVKTTYADAQLPMYLFVDTTAQSAASIMDYSAADIMREIAAIFIAHATETADTITLFCIADSINALFKSNGSYRQSEKLLTQLYYAPLQQARLSLSTALTTAKSYLPQRGICVILSQFDSTEYYEALSAMSRLHTLICIRIIDTSIKYLPQYIPHIPLSLSGSRASYFVPITKLNTNKIINDEQRALFAWQKTCRAMHALPIVLDVAEQPIEQLYRHFH